MGTLCAITNKQILDGDEVVAIMLTKAIDHPIRGFNVYSWDMFSPVNILLSTVWNHGLSDLSLYKEPTVIEETFSLANSQFEKHIQTLTHSKKSTTLLVNDNIIFKDIEKKIKEIDQIINFFSENNGSSHYEKEIKFLEENKKSLISLNQKTIQKDKNLYFMVIRKDIFDRIINEHGTQEYGEYVESNAINYQNQKKSNNITIEPDTYEFLEKGGNYAGGNKPYFGLTDVFKGINKQSDIKDYQNKLTLNFLIFNDFLQSLGKQYLPNMFFSDTPYDFGYGEATELLKDLQK